MAIHSTQKRDATRGTPGEGKSKAAKQRRERARFGRIHGGEPGAAFQIGNTVYAVAKDGSFRRGQTIG